jgi:LuxR family maltose regulon positive regulatory protein
MIGNMGSAAGSDAVAGGLAGPGAAGIVSRPRLFARLETSARVTVVSASPGSGKTVLLRSWISHAGTAGSAAWVTVRRGERDPQQFWLSVLGALRQTVPGRALMQPLSAAPDLDGWAITERLLTDLASLQDQVHLVIDDLHELDPGEAQRQLELLMMRAPAALRFVLGTRHDVRLGLHRLRLEGELAEIREPDLRFTVAEAEELFDAVAVKLPDPAPLVERTEGWAAGLRLAALSLAGHPDPRRFAEEFSGTERTVAEYLLAEVLDRQPDPVRLLLLRTSVLERVNGELAELLTGDSGGERVLQDLEQANAFVVALDTGRSWFRYHHLFAELLQLELRRTASGEVPALHRAAARWFAGHGHPVDAVRHAQAAADWGLAARLLADNWYSLQLDGQAATARQLLAAFPAETRTADAELAALAAAEELAYGSLEAAERHLALAERGMGSVPDARRTQAQLLLGITRLILARQRWDLPAAAEEVRRLQAMTEAPDEGRPPVGEELRALALISLGSTEFWAAGADPDRHLEMGVALARRIGRPFLEFTGLAYQTAAGIYQSFTRAADRGRQAIELARRNGWDDEPAAGLACVILAAMLAWQMRPGEAEPWVRRAARVLKAETEPAAVLAMYQTRGMLELAGGRDAEAVAAFQAAERLGGRLTAPHRLLTPVRAWHLYALVRLGDVERAERALAGLDERDRGRGEMRVAAAALRLAQGEPRAATDAVAPVLDGSAPVIRSAWLAGAFLLEAIARDSLGDPDAAGRALERALSQAEPDGTLLWFWLHPAPGLLRRQGRYRTAHPALIADILSLLAGQAPATPAGPPPPLEPLSDSEIRVLRYLPTNLSAPQIASELHVSHNTIRTHMRHLYAKLGSHRRLEAVERARALGLLAPSPLRSQARLPG